MNSNDRYHSLDALRAFALLLGVVFHSGLAYVLPPVIWAVGTTQPSRILGWFTFYTHSFRMELFFLLAGFFGALVVEKRGVAPYVRDRARRILLVFLIALYPMKLALGALWVAGGLQTGWLELPPDAASLPWWRLALGIVAFESWPNVRLTHLWFLYYLLILTALFLAGRSLVKRCFEFRADLGRVVPSRWFPVLLAMFTTPLLGMMASPHIDTPDQGFSPNLPVLALYGCFFALGWWLHAHVALLDTLARRWRWLLGLGLAVSVPASIGVGMQFDAAASAAPVHPALKWATSFGSSLTMTLSVFGWVGLFVRFFASPSERIRYVADASYWIYLVHLPLVVGFQVALAKWALPWWMALPLMNVIAFAILILSYHAFVRFTWMGAWLNGRRAKRPGTPDISSASHTGIEPCPAPSEAITLKQAN